MYASAGRGQNPKSMRLKLRHFAADVMNQVQEGVNPAYALVMMERNWDMFWKSADRYKTSRCLLEERQILGENSGPLFIKLLPYSSLSVGTAINRDELLASSKSFFVAVATICKTMNQKMPRAKYARGLTKEPKERAFESLRTTVLEAHPVPGNSWDGAWEDAPYLVAALFGEVLRTLESMSVRTKEVIEFK